MEIETTDEIPVVVKRRRLAAAHDKILSAEIHDNMLPRGIIKHSRSTYAAAMRIVRKMEDGKEKLRPCTDFVELNKKTH